HAGRLGEPGHGGRVETERDHVAQADLALELARRAAREDRTRLDERDLVAQLVRLAHVVRRQHDRHPPLSPEVGDMAADAHGHVGVRAASRATSWPSTVTLPESGVSRVARIDRSVVFPAPFGPSSPTMAPRGTVSDTPRSAAVRVGRNHPDLKVFVTSRASIASTGPDGNMRCMTTPGE